MEVLIEARLKKLTDKWQEILSLLGPDMVLTGGFVLQTVLGLEWPTDIDIVTTKALFHPGFGSWKRSKYGELFPSYSGKYQNLKIDIIRMYGLKEIDKFDFDFCKIWFDGKEVHMMYPEAVKSKTCLVDYDPHGFIHENGHPQVHDKTRIEKYRKRGFNVKVAKTFNERKKYIESVIFRLMTQGHEWKGSDSSDKNYDTYENYIFFAHKKLQEFQLCVGDIRELFPIMSGLSEDERKIYQKELDNFLQLESCSELGV